MGISGRQQAVHEILANLNSLDGLKCLFWEELNYERENIPLSRHQWSQKARDYLIEDPILLASAGPEGDFHVIYCRLALNDLMRVPQRQVVSQLIRKHPYSLFVFSNDKQFAWHFLNLKFDEQSEKRRLARRITVQPGDGLRTAAERISLLDVQNIKKKGDELSPLVIQQHHDEAFDVEKVTKEFYQEIANWYFWARDTSKFPKDAPLDAEGKHSLSLIRLLARLIFCWFLREKRNPENGVGLIPHSLFDLNNIKALLKNSSPKACTYYTAILQNLFFATLNTEMDKKGQKPNRRFLDEGDGRRSDDHMVHQFWRNAKQLKKPSSLEKLLRDIPFLNGGLFECLDDRVKKGNSPYTVERRIDGFSSKPEKQPKLPNMLFFGNPKSIDLSDAYGDAKRNGETVRPLLNILSRYNFTLTENTPFDQEVALDPELLGHVFENLLAAFNPETGTIARKATGSFYTPRVVVDWMVDRSLIVYLRDILVSSSSEKINDAELVNKEIDDKLKKLLSWEEEGHDFSPAETDILIDGIDGMKVIDPACGSGAFPMGMLQKLVHILQKLDPENRSWKHRQEKTARNIESSPTRTEALKAIEKAFSKANDDYGRKLYIIENCIYGVDIQPIAVQIAKLRLFISLIVDQAIDPNEENYGILPLPNLETKIVAANTLIGLHRGQLVLRTKALKNLETELQKVRHDYFTARSYKLKKELRNRDKQLSEALSEELERSGECTSYDAKRLAGWNPYDTNTHVEFFDPGWMFGLPAKDREGVFDIVIGNPPYVRQEELKKQKIIGSNGETQPLKAALKSQYECYTGTADLYVYFFERSLQFLRRSGVLSFITSNKYFRASYGKRLRTFIAYSTRPSVLLDFGDTPVFTSIAYPAIIVTQKLFSVELNQLPKSFKSKHWKSRVMTWRPKADIQDFPDIFEKNSFTLSQSDLITDGWRLESPVSLRLLDRLHNIGTPLGEYVKGRFYYGIKTGFNKAFVVDRSTRDRLIAEHESSSKILKPFLRGRDVKRWRCEPKDIWLVFTRRGIDIKKYPAIYEYLTQFKKRLTPGIPGGRKPGSYKWYEIQDNIAYWREFEEPKIVYQEIATYQAFAWEECGSYTNNKTFLIPEVKKIMLCVLNSNVSWWFLGHIASKLQGGAYAMQTPFVKKIPIPSATSSQELICEKLVDAMIFLHSPASNGLEKARKDMIVAFFEELINGLVYELFFPNELQSKKLKLFGEIKKLGLYDFSKLSDKKKITKVKELHKKVSGENSVIANMLYDLKKLDVVKVIEDEET